MAVKRILLALLIICGLAIASAGALRLVSSRLGESLLAAGLEFESPPHISFFPPSLATGNLVWHGRIAGYQLDFSARSAHAALKPASLLAGKPEFIELEINKPDLEINPSAAPAPVQASLAGEMPSIGRLVCQDGRIRLHANDRKLVLENLRLTAANLKSREEIDLQSDFTLNYSAPGLPLVTSISAIQTKARYYAPNLTLRDLRATMTLTSPAAMGRISPLTIGLNGGIDVETSRGRIQALSLSFPGVAIKGHGQSAEDAFQGAVEINVTTPFHEPVNLASALTITKDQIQLPGLKINFNNCSGVGAVSIAFLPAGSPQVKANFQMGSLELPIMQTSAEAGFQALLPAAHLPVPDFHLTAAFTEIRSGAFHLSSPAIRIAGDNNGIRLEEFSCSPGHGKLLVSGEGDFLQNSWRLTARGDGVLLGEFLDLCDLEGFEYGPANFELGLKIESADRHFLLPTLAGRGNLEFRDLRLKFMQDLAPLLPTLQPLASLPDLIKKGKIGMVASNGVLEIAPFQFAGKNIKGDGSARVDLAERRLKGAFVFSVNELRIPISLSGSFDDPDIQIRSPEAAH